MAEECWPAGCWPDTCRARRLTFVTDAAEKLYEGALKLPDEDREALALRILATVPRTTERVAAAWREEVIHRVEQIRRGEVETESWEQVQAQIDEALSR